MWGTIIDVVLIAIIVISAVIGIWKGFIDSLLSLVGTTLAGVGGVFLAKFVAPFVNRVFGLEEFLMSKLGDPSAEAMFATKAEFAKFGVWVITVLALFLILKLAIFILAKIFESVVKNSPAISGINRVLGMVFGIVKGAVTVLLLLVIANFAVKIPGIGDTINAKIGETKICKWVDGHVDEFVEDNLTKEKIDDIIDRIVTEATGNQETTETPSTESTDNTLNNTVESI